MHVATGEQLPSSGVGGSPEGMLGCMGQGVVPGGKQGLPEGCTSMPFGIQQFPHDIQHPLSAVMERDVRIGTPARGLGGWGVGSLGGLLGLFELAEAAALEDLPGVFKGGEDLLLNWDGPMVEIGEGVVHPLGVPVAIICQGGRLGTGEGGRGGSDLS